MPSSSVHAQDRVLLLLWIRICRWLWKVSGFLGTAILLSLGVNLLSTSLNSSRGLFPANSPFAAFVTNWPITLSIGSCFLLVAALAGAISQWYPSSRTLPLPTKQDHDRMVRRLRLRYSQLLAQTLQGAALLDLGLSHKPDAVLSVAALALRLPDQPERILPFGTSLVSVYDKVEQELLILGEPGAGKSTLLLELAQHLVERAEQERSLPLPVILPLSSWAVRRLPLHDWMWEQMALLYDVPRHLSQQWAREEHLLPLLDGLDEMEASAHAACILSINAYHQEHLHPLVVCSRTAEYDTASTHERLALHSAVVVQPLTKQQVDISLSQVGKPMDGLRAALNKNPVLRELASTPLWLSVLMLTYQGKTALDLPKLGSLQQQQQQILTHYSERMIERKGNPVRYPLQSTQIWLSWLARQMRMHNQTVFYLEYLQTDWLPERRRPFYKWSVGLVGVLVGVLLGVLLGMLFSGLVGVLLGGLVDVLLSVLFSGLFVGLRDVLFVGLLGVLFVGPGIGLVVGLVVGLLVVLLVGLLGDLHAGMDGDNLLFGMDGGLRAVLRVGLVVVLFGVLFGGLLVGLLGGLLGVLLGMLFVGLLVGLLIGLLVGLFDGLLVGLFDGLHGMQVDVVLGVQVGGLAELVGGWRVVLRVGLRFGLLIGLIYGVVIGLIYVLLDGLLIGLLIGLLDGLLVGLLIVLLVVLRVVLFDVLRGGLRVGLRGVQVGELVVGLLVGLRTMRRVGLVGVLAGVLVGALVVVLQGVLVGILVGVLVGVLLVGLVGMLSIGLGAVVQHFILRFWLWRTRLFPWNAPQFLDDAAARILLRRVGGGYTFAHRLLLDFFADLESELPMTTTHLTNRSLALPPSEHEHEEREEK